jgi:hypothetical protein
VTDLGIAGLAARRVYRRRRERRRQLARAGLVYAARAVRDLLVSLVESDLLPYKAVADELALVNKALTRGEWR